MTREEKLAILKDIIDGEIINPQIRKDVGEWAIKALEQEPKSEWQKDHEILKAYSDGANEMLDNIDEIITDALDKSTDQKESQTLRWVLDKISEVIDKYKAEKEESDDKDN